MRHPDAFAKGYLDRYDCAIEKTVWYKVVSHPIGQAVVDEKQYLRPTVVVYLTGETIDCVEFHPMYWDADATKVFVGDVYQHNVELPVENPAHCGLATTIKGGVEMLTADLTQWVRRAIERAPILQLQRYGSVEFQRDLP